MTRKVDLIMKSFIFHINVSDTALPLSQRLCIPHTVHACPVFKTDAGHTEFMGTQRPLAFAITQ